MENFYDPTLVAALLQIRAAELDVTDESADYLLGLASEILVFGEVAPGSDLSLLVSP
tara:strand:+ start:317 stop:487 length:171 start_codon:yes stop_codon:yes gene_type:complete